MSANDPTRYRFAKAVDPGGLRDELLAAGIAVSLVNPVNGSVDIDIPAADYDRAAAIVQAHDKNIYDQREQDERNRFALAVTALKNFATITSGTATNIQRDNAIKALTVILQRVVQELKNGN